MKKFILTALILTCSASMAFAHCGVCGVGDEKHEEKGSMKAEEKGSEKGSMKMDAMKAKAGSMFDNLNLSDEQKAKLDQLKATKDKAMKAAMTEFDTGIKGILTEDQLKIYEALHQAHQH